MAKTFGVEVLQTDFVDNSGAVTANDVTGLAFLAQANKVYDFKFTLFVQFSAGTRSAGWGVNANPTTAPTLIGGKGLQPLGVTAGTDTDWETVINAYGSVTTSSVVAATASPAGYFVTIEGRVQPAAAQQIFPRLVPNAAAGSVTVKALASSVMWREI